MLKYKLKNKDRIKISRKRHTTLSAVRFSYPLVVALLSVSLIAISSIQTTQNLIASTQNVLGEDEQSEEQKQAEEAMEEAAKQNEEEQKESAKQAEEATKERDKITTPNTTDTPGSPRRSIKSKTETISPSALQMKSESEDNKKETEIETADGQKIKTKIEDDGTTKIEVENGLIKLKYSVENGQVVLKVENEEGEAVEINDDELEELENDVEDELEDDNVRLVPTADNQLAVTQNQIAALTNFPLSINVATKEFIITTPAGQKVIAVLPDKAVQNLLATGIINSIETPSSEIANQDQFGTLTGVVEIETRNNEIVYKIRGNKTHRILGIIPVTTSVTAFVSTDTGLAVAKRQSILTNVIELLSP